MKTVIGFFPPPLTAMAARKTALERERTEAYARVIEALDACGGCVSRAGVALWPDLTAGAARDKCNRYVRRFGLIERAAELRVLATGRARGRQDT